MKKIQHTTTNEPGARGMAVTMLFAILALVGCAAQQPALRVPVTRLAIPVDCIDKVLHGTTRTKCDAIPNHPDWADCGHVIVHYTCTRSVQP
jgi:hypothetical protein